MCCAEGYTQSFLGAWHVGKSVQTTIGAHSALIRIARAPKWGPSCTQFFFSSKEVGIDLSCSISVWKRKVTVQKSFPCTSSPLFWFEVFLWKFLNEVGPWGPTEFRNFHKNTEIQKRGEQGQGMIFCTWNLLFHSQIEQELPFLIEGLLSAQDKLEKKPKQCWEFFGPVWKSHFFLHKVGKVTFSYTSVGKLFTFIFL